MAPEGRRYHVQHVLGRGGFGTVYQAEMLSGGGFAKPVALKVLNQEMGGMAEVAQRLRDEARLLGRLKHPAILRVDDLVQLEGCWTVVMELLAGANLHQIVRATGPLPLGIALEVTHIVAGALHAAHDRPGPRGEPLRVLHRDIKPSNIQLTPHGEVKVLDFGVARASFATREAATRSLIFGSVGYMAPERMAGRDSHAGDVYALGVVLYEVLAGRRLGTACSHASLQTTMVEQALEDLAQHHPDEDLHRLIRDTLSFEAEARPRADELQRRARRLRARFSDPWMSDWADSVLRDLMKEQEEGDGPLTGKVLHERSGEATPPGPFQEQGPERPRRAGFTPLPFEPSEPHTPTAGQSAPWADDIPSEPLGLPPLPQPRDRSQPTPAPTVPRPALPEEASPREASDPAHDDSASTEKTRFERISTPQSEPSEVALLEEAATRAQPSPGAAAQPIPSAPPPPAPAEPSAEPAQAPATPGERRRRGAPMFAVLAAVTALAVGLALWLGPREEDPVPLPPVEQITDTPPSEPSPEPHPPPLEPSPSPAGSTAAEREGPAPAPPAPRDPASSPSRSAPSPKPEPPAAGPAAPAGAPTTHTPASEPEAPPPDTATLTVRGDATSVMLKNEQGSHGPGVLPPGHYEIMASFPGLEAPVSAGQLQASAGDRIVIECQSGFDICKVAEQVREAWGAE